VDALLPLALFISVSADPIVMQVPAGQFEVLTWAAFLGSLIPVTLGNVVGGGGLVGGVYWLVYLRHEGKQPPADFGMQRQAHKHPQ
jgi:formate/nitrite transporter FocA (FNT family)